jgi:hypothetical protein
MDLMWDKMQADFHLYSSTFWIGQVHDSVIFDTMPFEVKRVAKLGIEVFESLPSVINKVWGVNFNLPLTGEATCGRTYGDQTASIKHIDGKWIVGGNLNELCRG